MLSTVAEPMEALTAEQANLVERHLSLVRSIARGWSARCRGGIEALDLEQAGMLGLMEAARRFDGRHAVEFAGFASVRVRGAICDFLRAHDPLSRGRRQAVRAMEVATRELENELGRSASSDEVAASLGWDSQRVGETRGDVQALRHGWAQVQDGSNERIDAQPCPRPGPHEALADRETQRLLTTVIDSLPERERLVVSLYYFEELPLKAISEILGVTESRVSQLHSVAIGRLRKSFPSAAERSA